MRAQRIEKLIKKKAKHDLNSMQSIQCDVFNNEAYHILPLLIKVLESIEEKKKYEEFIFLFKKWDFMNDEKCLVCGIYRLWVDLLLGKLEIKGLLKERVLFNVLYQNEEKAIKEVYPQFALALKKMGIKSIKDLKPWGEIHFSFFNSLAGRKRFPSDGIPIVGGKQTVNVAKVVWRGDHFESRFAASQRLIVELSSPPKAWSILPGPQKDYHPRNPKDKHGPWMKWNNCTLKRNLFPLDWKKVETKPLVISKNL